MQEQLFMDETDEDFDENESNRNTRYIYRKPDRSLVIPIMSLVVSGLLVIFGGWSEFMFTGIFGFGVGGLLPIILITLYKVDLSPYFTKKMIICVVYTICFVFSLLVPIFFVEGVTIVLFFVGFVAEIVCSIQWGNGEEETDCLVYSSSCFFYFGIIIDLIRSLHTNVHFNIPG